MDWKNLGFDYMDTNGYVIIDYKNGKWGDIETKKEPYFPIHIAANCLHYGQACFEGMKAFRTKDNKVVIFRPDMNADRIRASAERLCMKAPSKEQFIEACKKLVRLNLDYVPPYGTGASLYIRPVLIGTEPMMGVNPSNTYSLIIMCMPVGPYYKTGFLPVKAVVVEDYDRAAPLGTGYTKMAGNYAAGMMPGKIGKNKGYPIVLYLDPKEKKYVDEFGTSNFIGITKNNEYKTPSSCSILPSITNDSLQTLAKEIGLEIVKEDIAVDSLDQFKEVGACGTAAVITPIYSVKYKDKEFTWGSPDKAGETLTKLYNMLQGIQYGEIEYKYGWMVEVN